ncbi:MAG: hypothetical protein E4H20_04215 [Spirochaetales bacterium]|nr:MAG: hypothetical protein E4H20_04215 [Spirochaetales bacterium]
MKVIRTARRVLGALLFVFAALPLSLGGLSLLSVRQWATDPAVYKSLVQDNRFTALLESPDLPKLAPASIQLDEFNLEGPALVQAYQAAVPAKAAVDTAMGAIDALFSAFDQGASAAAIDLTAFKRAIDSGSSVFASTYLERATDSAGALPRNLLPAGAEAAIQTQGGKDLAVKALSDEVRAQADKLPDALSVPLVSAEDNRDDQPINLTTARAGLSAAAFWLTLTGGALCLASAFLSEERWRRRLGTLGSRVLLPGAIVLVIGLLPHLFNPIAFVRLPSVGQSAMNAVPALVDYLKFVAGRLGGGFLITGLVTVGLGTALVSVKRAIPPSEEEEEEEEQEFQT